MRTRFIAQSTAVAVLALTAALVPVWAQSSIQPLPAQTSEMDGMKQTPAKLQPMPEHLSNHQLNTLISTAKTPAEHRRIAQYYQSKAKDYLAQVKEHEAMVAAYTANPSLVNDKNRASTINHCQYFVETFKALAANSEQLEALHNRMAEDAPEKVNSTGK